MRTFITPLVLISILAGAGCTTGVRVSYEPARLDLGPVETYRSGICATKTSVPKELTAKVEKSRSMDLPTAKSVFSLSGPSPPLPRKGNAKFKVQFRPERIGPVSTKFTIELTDPDVGYQGGKPAATVLIGRGICPTYDSDGDLATDENEEKLGTNPNLVDSDRDGLEDGQEDANANGVVDVTETSPMKKDTDGDTLDDGVEDANRNGKVDKKETDPRKRDTDGDGKDDNVDKHPRNPKKG